MLARHWRKATNTCSCLADLQARFRASPRQMLTKREWLKARPTQRRRHAADSVPSPEPTRRNTTRPSLNALVASVCFPPVADTQLPTPTSDALLRVMSEQECWRRWDPLPDLSDDVLVEVEVRFARGVLTLSVVRNQSPDILLKFNEPEAFKVYEECSDVAENGSFEIKRMGEAGWNYPWPFQEVERSSWLSRVTSRNGAISDRPFRHYVIKTFDRAVHVMCDQEPEATLSM